MSSLLFLPFLLGLLCPALPASAAPVWEEIGPNGGDLLGIERSPDAPDTLFALSFVGVFRSSDAGASWEHVHTPEMGFGTVALAFDRTVPNRVFLGSDAAGVFASDDLGDTWRSCATGLPRRTATAYFPTVSLETTSDGRLFVGLRQVAGNPDPPAWIYRTTSPCNFVAAGAGIVFDPTAPPLTQNIAALLERDATGRLFALVYGSGVYRNSGDAWVPRTGDLPAAALRATFLALDPQAPGHLLLGTENDWIYETYNVGGTWSPLALPAALDPTKELPLVYHIAIDPVNAEFIYALALDASTARETPLFSASLSQREGVGGYLTADGGHTFTRVASPLARAVIDPTESVATTLPGLGSVVRARDWLATSYGVENLRASIDGLATLSARNAGLTSVLVNRVWLDPTPPGPGEKTLLVAAEEGLSLRVGEGPAWTSQKSAEKTVYTWSFADDPRDDDQLLYATGHPARLNLESRGLYRTDLGCFGNSCPPAEQLLANVGVWRVVTTTAKPDAIYLGTQAAGVLESTDRGESFRALNEGLVLPIGITDLALDAAGDPLLASARTFDGDITADPPRPWLPTADEPGGVYRRVDGRWVASPDITGAVYALAAHPANDERFLAASIKGLYETRDAGATFSLLLATTRIHDVKVDPRPPHCIYVASPSGVLRSTDDGVQFHRAAAGLWQAMTLSLEIDGDTGTVYAGTLGGSVFRLVPEENPAPEIAIDPSEVLFEETRVGFSSSRGATLTNVGEADLIVTDITSGDPAFTAELPTLPFRLTPGSTTPLELRFTPTSVGTVASEVTLRSNDPTSPAFAFAVRGEARAPTKPVPSLTSAGAPVPATVENGVVVELEANIVAGDFLGREADYWLRHVPPDGTVRWFVRNIGWVTSSTPVAFDTFPIVNGTPLIRASIGGLATGPHTFTLAVDENADGSFDATWSTVAKVEVEPVPPMLLLHPARISFGDVPLGSKAIAVLTLANTGQAELIVDHIDSGFAAFSFPDPGFPVRLAAGKTRQILLEFSPARLGGQATQLVLYHNDPRTTSRQMTLTGTGIDAR